MVFFDIVSRLIAKVSANQQPAEKNSKNETNKLIGPSAYLVDIDDTQVTSQHHPWACSLKTRGFRGRHRCGVTLLSGE